MELEVVYGSSVITPVVLIVLLALVELSDQASVAMVTGLLELLPPISLLPLVVKVPASSRTMPPLWLAVEILTPLASTILPPELRVKAMPLFRVEVRVPLTSMGEPLFVTKLTGLVKVVPELMSIAAVLVLSPMVRLPIVLMLIRELI